jgi:hypothetical protein
MKYSDLDFALQGLNTLGSGKMKGKLLLGLHKAMGAVATGLQPAKDSQESLWEQHGCDKLQEGDKIPPAYIEDFAALMAEEVEGWEPDGVLKFSDYSDVEFTREALMAMENAGIMDVDA